MIAAENTERFDALIGVAPVAHFAADAVAFFAGLLTKSAYLFTLLATEFARLFARHIASLPGAFPRFQRTFPDLIPPLAVSVGIPETSRAARDGEHYQCNHAEEQKFHGVIDEGNPDLFLKKLGPSHQVSLPRRLEG